MNKDWDKVCVSSDIWKECLRVLKPGAFAFIMSAPRQDVLSRMVVNLQDAGFETGFTSIYWTYASGFPKAADVSKLVDKRNGKPQRHIDLEKYLTNAIKTKYENHYILAGEMGIAESLIRHWIGKCGDQYLIPTLKQYSILKNKLGLDNRFDQLIEWEEAEREIIGKGQCGDPAAWYAGNKSSKLEYDITKSATAQARALDGAYAGFQPKPALEICLVCMKPLSEKSYVDQALANKKGITWLDDCRIPYQNEDDKILGIERSDIKGRFPANLLVSDDVLNDGRITGRGITGSGYTTRKNIKRADTNIYGKYMRGHEYPDIGYPDTGSFSRYFDLDRWFSTTFPFAIIPKASKSERNMGLITSYMQPANDGYRDYGFKKRMEDGKITGPKSDAHLPRRKVNEETSEGGFRHGNKHYFELQTVTDGRQTPIDNPFQRGKTARVNTHPTVKPLKLMTYLIMLGSRENDLVLDPFCGSGTTLIAAKMLNRRGIGIEINQEYCEIAHARSIAQLNKVVI